MFWSILKQPGPGLTQSSKHVDQHSPLLRSQYPPPLQTPMGSQFMPVHSIQYQGTHMPGRFISPVINETVIG